MSDEQKPIGDTVAVAPTTKKKKRPPFLKECQICKAPQDIQAEVKQMLVGTPANPYSNPPTKAKWVTAGAVSVWLSQLPNPIKVSGDSVRWHQHQHLKIRRKKEVRVAQAFAGASPPPPPPTTSDRTASGAKKRYRRGGYVDDLPLATTLPVEKKTAPTGVSPRIMVDGNAPMLSETKLLDPPPADDAEPSNATTTTVNPAVVEVVDGEERVDDKLDQLALAPPPQANTDLAYFEMAFREQAKTQARIAMQIRKRPDGGLTQAEAYLLVNGPKSLSEALVNYRQAMTMTKGGRYGAPAVMDQKRGLKGLLHSDRVVIPGDLPPKDAEPVGVPTPLEEQLAPSNQTLPVGKEGIPDKVPLPSPTLADLSAHAAPASSPRPVMDGGGGVGGAGTNTPEPMQKAVGDGVVGNGGGGGEGEKGGGATVTPIKPITPKRWDSVT